MAKLKDGFYKQTAESLGSDLYVLLAGGGSKPLSDFATASDSPTLTDYYWADQKITSTASFVTTPTVSSITATSLFYLKSDDATLKIYPIAGLNSSNYGNEAIAMQTCFDGKDPSSSNYVTDYSTRTVLSLQPRGGRVGIGTTIPQAKLDIIGDVKMLGEVMSLAGDVSGADTNADSPKLWLGAMHYSESFYTGSYIQALGGYGYGSHTLSFFTKGSDDYTTAPVERMRISPSGNVGIGITNPQTKLHINTTSQVGQILNSSNTANGIRFDTNNSSKGWVGWSDTYGTSLYNYSGSHYFGMLPSGTPHYDGANLRAYIFGCAQDRYIAASTDLNTLTNYSGGWWGALDNTTYTNGPGYQNFGLLAIRLNTVYWGQIALPYSSTTQPIRYRSQTWSSSGNVWQPWQSVMMEKYGSSVCGTEAAWSVLASWSTGQSTELGTDVTLYLHSSFSNRYGYLHIRVRRGEYLQARLLWSVNIDVSKIRVYYSSNYDNIQVAYLGGESYSQITAELVADSDRSGSHNNRVTCYRSYTAPSYTSYVTPTYDTLQQNISGNANTVDNYHAGITNGTVSIYVAFPTQSTLQSKGFLSSSYGTSGYGYPDNEFLQAICKWAIDTYANNGDVTLMGIITPNSSGTCIIHLYSSSGKDSTTKLPRYCRGQYLALGGNLYHFGTYEYVWSYNRFASASELKNPADYYWANVKVSATSSNATDPTFRYPTSVYSQFTNGSEIIGYVGRGGANNNLYFINYKSAGIYISTDNTINKGIYIKTGGNVGIGNDNPSYKLHVSGDSYTTGWSRATNGFYVENMGVHYMAGSASGIGQIYLTNNEFNWGASNANLYFNYRAAANGTTVTNYIWNAGSSSSYATHTMGLTYFRGSGKYLRIGPQNSSHAHYETDATVSHWFNKTVQVNGNVEPYGNNTYDLGTTGTRWKTVYAYTMYASTAFYQSSDVRLKTNIQNLSKDLLDRVYNINEVSFNWKESGEESFGYIAQDYEAISKTFVDRQDDGTLTLDYTKALVAQIAALKQKIVNLEERLHSLERS